MSTIELQGLVKRFGNVDVVKGIDARFEHGSIVALLGASGCGKTTTLRILAGLDRCTSGVVRIGDRVVDDGRHFVPPEQRGLGMVFQSYAVWPHKSVRDNVAYPLTLRGATAAELDRRVRDALAQVKLDALAHRMPHELSGGQQQRVALARALVHTPEVLLLDEPLSNLDARLREEMRAELAIIARQAGTTVVHVTHDQAEAFALADVVCVLRDGRMEQLGSPDDVYARPATPFVGGFVGSMSFLTATARADDILVGDASLPRTGVSVAARFGEAHGPASLGVRPEWASLDAQGPLRGRVVSTLFLGADVEVRAATDAGALLIRVPSTAPRPRTGELVGIHIERAVLFARV